MPATGPLRRRRAALIATGSIAQIPAVEAPPGSGPALAGKVVVIPVRGGDLDDGRGDQVDQGLAPTRKAERRRLFSS
ncbi:MAG: hypothetical protein R3F11_19545 [Verrucomicrobiales bacterium]